MKATVLQSACDPAFHSPKNWYVIHTKPKQEVRASRNLEAWGVETFVPWLASRRKPLGSEPLFPGYVFALFNVRDAHKISFARGVMYIVSFGGILAKVDDEIMTEVRARTDENGVVQIRTILNEGDLVVVRSGPLENLCGIFEKEMPGKQRIQILLKTISFSARVQLSVSDVEKAPVRIAG